MVSSGNIATVSDAALRGATKKLYSDSVPPMTLICSPHSLCCLLKRTVINNLTRFLKNGNDLYEEFESFVRDCDKEKTKADLNGLPKGCAKSLNTLLGEQTLTDGDKTLIAQLKLSSKKKTFVELYGKTSYQAKFDTALKTKTQYIDKFPTIKPRAKTRFRGIHETAVSILASERIIRQLRSDDNAPSHSLASTPLNFSFVSELYKITTKITQLINYFEMDCLLNIHDFLPEMENLLIYAAQINTDRTEAARFENAFKRSLLFSLSEQLFQKSVDETGEIIINNMVPNRAQDLVKISMYLNFPRSTCRFFRAIKEFKKHEDDVQVYNTGQLICSETQKWQSDAKKTIVSIAANWGGSKTMDILTDLAEDNEVSDTESVDSELESRSQPISQPSYTNTIIGQELSRYETFTQQQWTSCKLHLIIYNIQIT